MQFGRIANQGPNLASKQAVKKKNVYWWEKKGEKGGGGEFIPIQGCQLLPPPTLGLAYPGGKKTFLPLKPFLYSQFNN